jgi:carotenoid cleavage dioxygenase-like enzyme
MHAGRIMALVETALPVLMSRELETLGFHDYRGKLGTAFTAHPKICPITGELHFFGYAHQPPFLTYHVANASGELTRSIPIPVKGSTMVHDFAITSGHIVLMDLPVVFDGTILQRGGTMPFAWSDDYGARLGILPRGGAVEALRWVDIEPCYVYHVANAFEEADGTIVIDVAWYQEHWRGGPSQNRFDNAVLKRWRVPPGASRAAEQFLDDHSIEFPRVNDSLVGSPHGVIYAVETKDDLAAGRYSSLAKYDLRSGANGRHDFESGLPSEFTYIAAAGGEAEDDGWLIGFVYDRARNASDLVILDAQRIEAKPLARIALPVRVPQGFHGNWIPDI